MTCVVRSRRYRKEGHLTFKRMSWIRLGTQTELTNTTRLGETSRGGRFRPIVPNLGFSRLQRKPIARWLAVGLRNEADVTVRRAVTDSNYMTATTDTADLDEELYRLLSPLWRQKTSGCAGVSHLCATPGCHTPPHEDSRKETGAGRTQGGTPLCAGCATPKRYYRVAGECTHPHTRRGKCSVWTQHTQHTHLSGCGNWTLAPALAVSRPRRCDTRGEHTDPPGAAHPNPLKCSRGGVHV